MEPFSRKVCLIIIIISMKFLITKALFQGERYFPFVGRNGNPLSQNEEVKFVIVNWGKFFHHTSWLCRQIFQIHFKY